ncbi:dnaJ homolog subfamily C member 24 isoform X2 [Girardinichthys multiradiatus]|uniref:dnaJ homolog subfamily C member 24 isoform X2 n=1 Tax=Girardinichthys multiradiatus TaxID=208333 RepID=UPI001FAC15BF|nr:dnaJ homolog subfamily C member 24 isoform X2 [Girardinichthys multiradiatus]
MCDPVRKDLYDVLGASPSDSLQQLRHRYKQLALKYHPDRLEGEHSSESRVKTFLEVDAAWKILSDQTTRRQYDMQRRDEYEYTYCCRCGGRFGVSKDEVEVETQRMLQIHNDEEMHKGQHSGVLVCCNTCSLTICVTWLLNQNMQMSK